MLTFIADLENVVLRSSLKTEHVQVNIKAQDETRGIF